MPAAEKTWRDQTTLHVIFGVTSLLLFLATVWMFAADHDREWKVYQRAMRSIDQRLTTWRLNAQELGESQRVVEEIEKKEVAARSAPPSQEDMNAFKEAAARFEKARSEGFLTEEDQESSGAEPSFSRSERIDDLYDQLGSAEGPEAIRLRERLLREMEAVLRDARFEEDNALTARKFEAAEFDVARATLDLAVRDNRPPEVQEELQKPVDQRKAKLDELTRIYQAASAHNIELKQIFSEIIAPENTVKKELEEATAESSRLLASLDEGKATYFTMPTVLGKKWLELPILDAFNSPLKIENLWTENLTMTYGSFGKVRRFDRCTTCHQAIDKTAAGSAVDPAYLHQRDVVLQLPTPDTKPAADQSLQDVYGLVLAAEGLLDKDDVTLRYVGPGSAAALASIRGDTGAASGFIVGDVITYVGADKVLSVEDATQYLLRDVDQWGTPLKVTVRRGLPNPYVSHPRLDLFVGSLSPHKFSVVGCSVCHEGQGSATEFKFVSHTPNSTAQEEEWRGEHGWYNNHHWIYPMYPKRFAESACLKCHHDVSALEPSERFPDPPAPKLTEGFHLVRRYGCYGCHEIHGFQGPGQRIGPDMRLEPNYFAAAAQVVHDPAFSSLTPEQQGWARDLIQHPDDDSIRHQLLALVQADAKAETPQLSPTAHKMADVLADIEIPGTERKVGPSLRHVKEKVGPTFLYDWIREPKHFRPTTRMPQFFGQWDHLEDDEREVAERYEPIEILGMLTYLLDRSQSMQHVDKPEDVDADGDIERGRVLFETRGCLACHKHDGYADANHGDYETQLPQGLQRNEQGPDLSNIGDKFALPDTPDAEKWLYTWLRNPNLYHPRTKMPDLYLETLQDADGNKTDPAADVAAFLLSNKKGWEPAETKLEANLDDLDALALEHLSQAFYAVDAEQYLEEGVPEALAAGLKGAEIELVGTPSSPEEAKHKKLLYVGRKTITKYGCFACHDIPGFEDAKPIGTALTEWGRKDPSKLAFEHIVEYIEHGHGHNGHAEHGSDSSEETQEEDEIDDSFYMHQLEGHDRTGFIWQKLTEPRSYDFRKARNKGYHERLRMPLFPLGDRQRESVVTFVLGLVAEPPAHEFVYHPDQRREAIIEGQKVVDKYNCAGCHIIDPAKWTLEYQPGDFPPQQLAPTFPFVNTQLPSEQLAASATPDPLRGTLRSIVEGVPAITNEDAKPMVFDEEGFPLEEGYEYDPALLEHMFQLRRPAALEGNTYEVSQQPLRVLAPWIKKQVPAVGGDLTFRLLPRVLELEKEENPAAKGGEAWGWLPPSLVGEGRKIQTDWLHSFLLDPYPIRPAVFMRMPRFNMSPDEATALANYFAAKDNADYPYDFIDRARPRHLEGLETAYREKAGATGVEKSASAFARFDAAMNIVTSSDYCIQCHIVGDFMPKGLDRALAPDLSSVYQRLRSNYVRNWIANPPSILPYTGMPINIPYDANSETLGGVKQELYHGTSVEQLDGLVDLLMNFNRYSAGRSEIAPLVQPAAGPAAEAAATTTEDEPVVAQQVP